MADPRKEALERAQLAKLRNAFNVERTDNTLLRDAADSVLAGRLPGPRGDQEAEATASAALSGLMTGFIAPTVGLGGALTPANDPESTKGYAEFKSKGLERQLPNLDPSYYVSREFGGVPKLRDAPLGATHKGEQGSRIARQVVRQKPGSSPGGSIFDDVWHQDFWDESLGDEARVKGVDWDATAQRMGRLMPKRTVSATNVPEFGPDLGGFTRGWQPDPENMTALTVVPNTNSGRFSQALLPAVIDQVYRKDAYRYQEEPGIEKKRMEIPAKREIGPEDVRDARPVPRTQLADLSSEQRVALLEKLAPGQISGRNQSGYIWGTTTEMPRYEYAGGSKGNPEIVISEVRTPPELQTKYLYTAHTHDPWMQLLGDDRASAGDPFDEVFGERKPAQPDVLGPTWGVSNEEITPGMSLSGRRKRNTAGDISFRQDLIERRGGFSLADAQAVQAKLGLPLAAVSEAAAPSPMTGAPSALSRGRLIQADPGDALQNAIDSIAKHEGISHGEVVERYARRLPRAGNTTAPRQPAQVRVGAMDLDTSLGITSDLKRAFDLPEALRQAGQEPTTAGIKAVNQAADDFAKNKIQAMRTVKFGAPGAGALMGLADPQAAELLGTALKQESPLMRTGLMRDAARVLGQNMVVGAAQGGLVSGAMAAAPYLGLAPQAAAVATGLTVAAPAMAGAAVVNTADSYLKGATGEGLAAHAKKVQAKAQPSGMAAAQQLFPRPQAVVANTPSGTARLSRTQPVNPLLREAQNRAALFKARFNPLKGELGLSELLLGR